MQHLSFDIASLLEGYRSGAFSVSQIVREVLGRIEAGDPKIWISVESRDRLLAQAAELDAKDPASLPLFGIPFAVKDNIDVAGLPTTAACPDFRYFAELDASAVARLRSAGAIPIGKTNLDQFATGLVGTRSPYGTPLNAFDSAYIPGGSSSGSAVSVALGQVAFALGTDTAGSGRIPACFNNLVGLKPTRGLISCVGLVPACKSLDCISIFALNAADAQTVFRAAVAFDGADPYSRPYPDRLDTARRSFREGMVFGVPLPEQLEFFGDEDYRELYLRALDRLEGLGFQRRVVDFAPFLETAHLLYEGPWVAERYWAIEEVIKNSPDSLHPVTRAIIEKGASPTAVQAFDAGYQLQALRQRTRSLWEEIDFLATPTAGTHYTIDQVEAEPVRLNSNLGRYTNYMNLLDLAAVATPTGFTSAKRPFGITLAAPAFHDEKLLAVADRLHRASDLPLGASSHQRHSPLSAPDWRCLPIAVCGAHMSGLPLNRQLTELGATFNRAARTAPEYRLFALPDTQPPKPGLLRDPLAGAAIEVEIWNLPVEQWAEFVALIPSPLGLANVALQEGTQVKGFVCEAHAVAEADDITLHGSWRTYLADITQRSSRTRDE